MDCIFCKIIKNEIPSQKIWEDEECLAILDINPTTPGHTLVMPKTHVPTLLESEAEVLQNILLPVQKISQALMRAVDAEGFNLVVNNGRVAGQLVDHLHFHIIPRREDDGLKTWGHGQYGPGELEQMAQKIRSQIN